MAAAMHRRTYSLTYKLPVLRVKTMSDSPQNAEEENLVAKTMLVPVHTLLQCAQIIACQAMGHQHPNAGRLNIAGRVDHQHWVHCWGDGLCAHGGVCHQQVGSQRLVPQLL